MNTIIIFVSKLSLFFIKNLFNRPGSTWPGEIALRLNNNFIKGILNNSSLKIILIAGTNGKTTTATLMRFLLEKNSKKVFQNEEGANLLNGIASSIIKNINIGGKFNSDTAIFEVDENTLPLALKQITPSAVIILNLFRDQLDRYGEVNMIASKWQESLKYLTASTIILNGDDPLINSLGKDLKSETIYFGVSKKLMKRKEIPHDVDSAYCPQCGSELKYDAIAYSHLGNYQCLKCGFKRNGAETYEHENINYPLFGLYNIYNINAVILTLEKVFELPLVQIKKIIASFKPAFGRQEVIFYKKRKFIIFLSKNPAGFNQAIETAKEMKGSRKHLLIVLNDRIPDGTDISWIWDVDFERIAGFSQIMLSGDRTDDLVLRLKYAGEKGITVKENPEEAIGTMIDVSVAGETIYVLATYTGMLEIRKILTGKKLL